ncbi:recombination-associated protein RdgC [Vibrio sp. 1180_3]|uniref:recombination-associated protein RdgC n=1 Tax=Vibrio sp. 1180_3 TaxID=2528832 RepID=UPI0024066DE3|nr:recombination-associated protein RdgC [Vibrio sp. 1180_3]MDF9399092.1 hypothetical protein [Vibrio sp. 1180_3]
MLKKLTLYRLNKDASLPSTESIERHLQENASFKPCNSTDLSQSGFINVGPSSLLCYSVENGRYQILEYQTEKKIIPSDKIKRKTQSRIVKAQLKLERKLSKDEKDQIKLAVTKELAKQAFSRITSCKVVFFNDLKLEDCRIIGIEATKKQAEDIISILRKAFGSLPVTPFTTDTPTAQQLQKILTTEESNTFTFGGNCTLENLSDSSEIRFKNRSQEEIVEHLSGHTIKSMSLTNEDINFEINEISPLALSKIKYTIEMSKPDKNVENGEQTAFDSNCYLAVTTVAETIRTFMQN